MISLGVLVDGVTLCARDALWRGGLPVGILRLIPDVSIRLVGHPLL